MSINAEGIEVELFVQQDRLEQNLKKIHKKAILTKDEYISLIPGYINDMEWNFYDELHRYYVHNTYHDMFKIFSGKTFSVNLVKHGNWPIFIQVANAKVAPNLFYQTMSILGIFYVHQIMELTQLDRQVQLARKWYIVSHWLFKPLHAWLHRSMMKLQLKQDNEDNNQIRYRRLQLRDKGYHFTTDCANFTNANQLTNNVIFPNSQEKSQVSLATVQNDAPQNITVGILELMVAREKTGIRVWPGICPHEGASLKREHLCKGIAQCPWHGRRFSGTLLTEGDKAWRFMDFDISIAGEQLIAQRVLHDTASKSVAATAEVM